MIHNSKGGYIHMKNECKKSNQSINNQNFIPDYKEMIIEMLPKVNNEKYLRRIYFFIKGFLEQG